MAFFVLPKYVASKSGQVIRGTDRGNRFRVTFTLGSMGACVTSAQAVCDLMIERTISQIRMNWIRGQRADGTTIGVRKKGRKIWGFGKTLHPLEVVAALENSVLNGTYKVPKEEPGDPWQRHVQIIRIKEWVKSVKDKYRLKGHTYKPTDKKRTGNWSGMILDTVKADPMKITAKDGKIPTKVSARITVTTKRKDAVFKLQMMRLKQTDPIMLANIKAMYDAARSTGIFRSWLAGNVKQFELDAVWNRFKSTHGLLSKSISMASKIGRRI